MTESYSSAPPSETPTEFVRSLQRGLSVIQAFSREHQRLSLSQVAEITGMTRATARRFLLTLEHLGYVGSEGRYFYLKPRVLQLGYAYLSSLSVAEVAQSHLEELAERMHESCSASVLDSEDVVYVARAATNRIMAIGLSVGTRLPAYCTSMGRVLLAALPKSELDNYLEGANLSPRTSQTVFTAPKLINVLDQVRDQGWCAQDQELELGVRSIAVPIRSSNGATIAAINISAHAARVTMAELTQDFLPELQSCRDGIELDLVGRV